MSLYRERREPYREQTKTNKETEQNEIETQGTLEEYFPVVIVVIWVTLIVIGILLQN